LRQFELRRGVFRRRQMRDSNAGLFGEIGQHFLVRGVALTRIVRPLRIQKCETDLFFRGLMAAGEKCEETREQCRDARADGIPVFGP